MFFLFASAVRSAHAQTNDLPALVPAYAELPPTFWERSEWTPAYWSQPCTVIMVGGMVGVVLTAIIYVLFVPIKPMLQPPEVDARSALGKLKRQPENGELLSEVSQILRRYICQAFELSPGEMTTSEFCATLAASETIGAELTPAISNFLRECDERKFSSSQAGAPLKAVIRALELIADSEKQRARISIPTNLGNK